TRTSTVSSRYSQPCTLHAISRTVRRQRDDHIEVGQAAARTVTAIRVQQVVQHANNDLSLARGFQVLVAETQAAVLPHYALRFIAAETNATVEYIQKFFFAVAYSMFYHEMARQTHAAKIQPNAR